MKITSPHRWDLDEPSARRIQRELAGRVVLQAPPGRGRPTLACGVDVAYDEDGTHCYAAAVTVAIGDGSTTHGEVGEERVVREPIGFPYLPGLLSFRELPPVIRALESLTIPPEVIVCDGHGYAHPARVGLACHLGILADLPTIGCAKTAFVGANDEPGSARGSRAAVIDDGELVGYALRTQDGVKPVYVSPGHLIDFDEACEVVLALSPQYRLPETTRRADQAVRRAQAAG